MRLRLVKVLFSFVLCFSLVPLAGMPLAWADDETGVATESASEGLTDADTDDADTPDPNEDTDPFVPGDNDTDAPDIDDEANVVDEPEESITADTPKDLLPPTGEALLPLGSKSAPLAPLSAGYSVEYRAHVQGIGWMGWVKNGKLSGTTGKSLRAEAFEIKLIGSGFKGSVEYRTHVQNIGWTGWVKNGKLSGTTGKSLRAEAVSIRLTGELAKTYNIYYRTYVQDFGWLGWAKNGEDAGSAGCSYRMEALEIRLVEKVGGVAPSPVGGAFKKPAMTLETRAHVQNIGWQNWINSSKTVGTTGRALRMEALCIRVLNADYTGSVSYRTYVQGIGWQNWAKDGKVAGTTGESRRVEAVEVVLTGKLAANYDIYYRVNVAGLGWLNWAKNGASAGAIGSSCRIEALQVRLVAKGAAAPGKTNLPFLTAKTSTKANVADKGWLASVGSGKTAGTTGQGRPMEAFSIKVNANVSGNIEYCAFVKDAGWQAWQKTNAPAGTQEEKRHIEAIKIRLTGDLSNYYDVYYRAHVANWGWLGWTKNGASAGTGKVGYALEAFQVVLVVKGSEAPGSTQYAYTEKDPLPATHRAMNARAAGFSSSTGWLIVIDTKNCLFGVYSGSKGNWTNRSMWLCSPGAYATPTIKGTYYVGSKGYVFGSGYSCYWWTQISGDYLIHSVLYYPGSNRIMEGVMGVPASQGCVRLDIQNAKWVYDNIPRGTTIFIY